MSNNQTTIGREPTPVPQMILIMAETIGLGLYPAVAAYGLWTLPPTQLPLIIGVFVLSLPIVFWGTTLIHELGHIIAGKLVGLTFILIFIGRLRLICEQGVIHVRVDRHGPWRHGGVSALPRTATHLRSRMCIFILGGPLFAIGVGIALFIATTMFVASAYQPALWWLGLYLIIVTGCVQFLPVTTGDPNTRASSSTDGWALARWWSRDPVTERNLALQVIVRAYHGGRAPRDFSHDWLDRVTLITDDQIQAVLGHSLALGAALAREDVVAVQHHLRFFTKDAAPLPSETAPYIQAGIARYLPQQRGLARLNILLHAALIAVEREDGASARTILDRLPATMPPELRGLHVHATAIIL